MQIAPKVGVEHPVMSPLHDLAGGFVDEAGTVAEVALPGCGQGLLEAYQSKAIVRLLGRKGLDSRLDLLQ